MARLKSIAGMTLPILFSASGLLGIVAFAYLRIFVVSNNPFDPFREYSVDTLWLSFLCFISTSATLALTRA